MEVVTRLRCVQCSRRLETHRCPAGVMGPARSSVRARRRAALVAYLQMAPAAEVIDACRRCEDPGENEGAESSSPHSSSSFGDVAQDALHRCVTHPIATSHPPTKAYIARLLKLATIEAERGGQTLNDLLVGHLVQQTFLSKTDTDDGWCHKTYAYGELLQGSDTDDDDTEAVMSWRTGELSRSGCTGTCSRAAPDATSGTRGFTSQNSRRRIQKYSTAEPCWSWALDAAWPRR